MITGEFATLMLALGAAWACGFSAFGAVAVLGLMVGMQDDLRSVGGLAVLASPYILWPAWAVFVVEIVVNKVPRWDVEWHLRNGWIRVITAATLAFLASAPLPIDVQIGLALLGAICAFVVHGARTGAHLGMREAGTASFATPVAGTVEDCLLVGLLLPLSVGRPGLTLMMIGVTLIATGMTTLLTWSSTRTILWDMLLGAEGAKPATGKES